MSMMASQKGYSLIVLAIVLAIAGVVIINMLPNESDAQAVRLLKNNDRLEKIENALNQYYYNQGNLPCPASFTTSFNSSNFGSPSCSCGSGIVCPAGTGNMLIGTVPTRALGLPDDYAIDSWQNRITYVMNNSTPSTTLNVSDLSGTPITDSNGHGVIALVISHGPDGIGAYGRRGTLNASSCSLTGANTTYSEIQNCDSFSGNTSNRSFLKSTWDLSPTNYTDDTIQVIYKSNYPLVGFKNDSATSNWSLFQVSEGGNLSSIESATSSSVNNV